jgi:hypothetical protein
LTIKSKYDIIKEKEKEKIMKTNLENIIKELDKALTENSELIFTISQELENKWENENLQRQHKKLETRHKKLYEMLISAKKLLKGLEY